MSILICENVALSYGVDVILQNISFSVNEGAKVGIIGANGAGKTTLFKIITGALSPTSGNVYIGKGLCVGFLEQITDDKVFGDTVENVAVSAFGELIKQENTLAEMQSSLESGDEALISRYSALHEKFISGGGLEYKERARAMLMRLGFDETLICTEADKLSGGQKTKLLLAVLLLRDPDIILLDEPTNHLDISSVDWLTEYIKSSKKTFLIVSHDRYFLDRVTTDTLEIEHKVSRIYSGSYSVYREKKRKLDEDALKHYLLQQKEIQRINDYIEQQRRWGQERNFVNIKNREKMLGRIEKLDKPKQPPKAISFEIAGSTSKSFMVLSVRNLSKSYSGVDLFDGISFEVHYSDRLFIIGDNGCGKSTLLKILTGREKQDSGVFELGYNQTIGYYDQEQKLLDDRNTVMDELWDAYSEKQPLEIRKILARFGFTGDDVFKPISVLSGGERARVSIAKMILKGVSLLVLDEPTNHLDIPSKEILENAISDYDGTVICVSHDRYFLNSLSTRLLDISKECYDAGYCLYDYGYERYLETSKRKTPQKAAKNDSQAKQEHIATKNERSRQRATAARLRRIEQEITAGEQRLCEFDEMIAEASSDYKKLNELYLQQESLRAEIDALYEEMAQLEWE